MALSSNVRGSELMNRGTSRSHAASINQNAADTTQLSWPSRSTSWNRVIQIKSNSFNKHAFIEPCRMNENALHHRFVALDISCITKRKQNSWQTIYHLLVANNSEQSSLLTAIVFYLMACVFRAWIHRRLATDIQSFTYIVIRYISRINLTRRYSYTQRLYLFNYKTNVFRWTFPVFP